MTIAGSGPDNIEELGGALADPGAIADIRLRLVGIFADALSLNGDDVVGDRPFFEMATSSLALVTALQRVSDVFGVRPSLRRVFEEFGTIDRLTGYLAELVGERPLDHRGDPRARRAAMSGECFRLDLAAAQQELVFLADLRPEAAAAWCETVVVELEGALRVDALRGALKALASRHEALRTRLTDDRTALCIDLDPAAVDLVVRDLPAVSDSDRLAQTVQWLRAPVPVDPTEALARFDLARFPYAPWQHVLRVTTHGLVADRGAVVRLVEELGALYTAECAGEIGEIGAVLPAAESFAEHQRREAAALDARREELAEFWRTNLASLPLTDLPADRMRPPIKRAAGDRIVVPIEPATVRRIRGDGGAMGEFLHVVAAVAAWTTRLSGQDDIVIGVFAQPLDGATIVANRTNPLPIRVAVDDRVTFADLRHRVSAAFFDAVDHGDMPFAEIVRALNPDRDQGRSPIFTVAVDREVWPALHFGDLSARIATAPSQYARYDLSLTLVEGPDFVHIRCDYSTELFEKATVRRYLACLRRLLDGTLENPACPVGALPLLAPQDRARIIDEWNRTGAPSPEDEPLFARIDRQAMQCPDTVAIFDGERRVTYGDLVRSANRLANRLRHIGVPQESRVAILMGRSLEAIVAMLGVLKAGAVYVPIDPTYPSARIDSILAASDAAVLIVDSGGPHASPGFAGSVIALSPGLAELSAESSEAPKVEVNGSALAYVLYTSGSTGRPKGVAVEHRSAVNLVSWARTNYDDDELSGSLASAPFCFDQSMFEIFAPLAWGGSLVLAKNLLELPSVPMRDRVKIVNTVPSALSQLLEVAGLPTSVRVINIGGEPIRQELIDRAFAAGHLERMLNWYGPTEVTVIATVGNLVAGAPRPPAIGRPLINTRVYVLDARDEPVPPGVAGELCVGGRGVARGYLGDPELTRRSFVSDPFVPGGRMYRTGDLARFREDGELEFLGRRDQQVKVRGFRIELGEIEACLLRHPTVQDVAILPAGDGADRSLIAWLVAAPGAALQTADLRAYLHEQLPAYMIPARFVELPALPLLSNGKLDRAALPAPDTTRESRITTDYAEPSTEIERALAAIWAGQLGVEHLGRNDNFFELGGHSLLLAPMMIEINRRLGLRVTLSEFFDAPTIATLAARLEVLSRDRLARAPLHRRIVRMGPEVDAYFATIRADAVLDPTLEVPGRVSRFTGEPAHFFITGVTGFVGTYTFQELLRRGRSRFTCLVRASDADEGRRRIIATMKRNDLWDPAFDARFAVVTGDLTRPHLGLSPDVYQRVTRECDAVLHIAAQVNFVYPYRALKSANVDGVHEAMRLCFDGRVKPFHYVSTAAIWPMGAQYRFFEDDDINHGVRLNIGYDDSKWVSEHLVLQARQRGLPVTVYRPGEVAGHSVTGRCALEHFMWAIVKGSIQMKVFPEITSPLDLGPVDYIAAAIAALALDSDALGGTYHLTNPSPGDPVAIYDLIREYGYPFNVQKTEDWIATLLARDDLAENALYPFVAILEEFEDVNLQLPTCDSTRARAALRSSGVTCPPVGPPLIRRYLDYLVEAGFLQPPAGA